MCYCLRKRCKQYINSLPLWERDRRRMRSAAFGRERGLKTDKNLFKRNKLNIDFAKITLNLGKYKGEKYV